MIGLVACSARKLSRPAPARQLYTSPLFRASLTYAELRCERVYVLSARHGLVELDQKLDAYDHKLGGKKEREAWGERIADRLVGRHGRDAKYLLLAGADYARPLRRGMHMSGGHGPDGWRGVPFDHVVEPLRRLQVGERLRWLERQIELDRDEASQLALERLAIDIDAASIAVAAAEATMRVVLRRDYAPLTRVDELLRNVQRALGVARDMYAEFRDWNADPEAGR